MNDAKIEERKPTTKDLEIGEGEGSSPTGDWRVIDFTTDAPMRVHYEDEAYQVESMSDWMKMPREGILVVRTAQGSRRGFDEYRYHGKGPKYGTCVTDEQWAVVLKRASHHVRSRPKVEKVEEPKKEEATTEDE